MVCDILYFMNIQLTKKQIVDLYQSLLNVADLKGARFSYTIAKNTLDLEPEVEAIRKAYTPSKEFSIYDKERLKIAEEHAEKVNGVPVKIVENGIEVYKMKDKDMFDTAIRELQAKHEMAIRAREEQVKEIDKILEEKKDVELLTVSIADIPNDITGKQLTDIFIIIEEKKKLVN